MSRAPINPHAHWFARERAACPGDPDGHLWVLRQRTRWEEERPTSWDWRWVALGLLTPPIGWFILLIVLFETEYMGVGWIDEWYCTRCRQFETTRARTGE